MALTCGVLYNNKLFKTKMLVKFKKKKKEKKRSEKKKKERLVYIQKLNDKNESLTR